MDKVFHFEIPSDDLDRAKSFYDKVFGWKYNNISVSGEDYTFAQTSKVDENGRGDEKNAINGAIIKRTNSGASPVIVAQVDSMEDTLKKAKDNGGEIVMQPKEFGDMGMYAHVKDSEGNVIGVFKDLR